MLHCAAYGVVDFWLCKYMYIYNIYVHVCVHIWILERGHHPKYIHVKRKKSHVPCAKIILKRFTNIQGRCPPFLCAIFIFSISPFPPPQNKKVTCIAVCKVGAVMPCVYICIYTCIYNSIYTYIYIYVYVHTCLAETAMYV